MGKVVTTNNHQELVNCGDFDLYCEYYGLLKEEVVSREDTLAYIESRKVRLDQLIDGYSQMGAINQQFSEQYLGCESGNFKDWNQN